LEYTVTTQDDGVIAVTLSGIINEDAELGLNAIATELADKKRVSFNFAQVKSVNSLGVRSWVQFLRTVDDGREITFIEGTPDVIMQINMIPSFMGRATIRSFYANYICESCDLTSKVLIDVASLAPKTIPNPQKCSNCGSLMETEELEEEYFAFLLR
jgi:hypothetical protein